MRVAAAVLYRGVVCVWSGLHAGRMTRLDCHIVHRRTGGLGGSDRAAQL